MLTRAFSQMGDSRCPVMGCVWESPRLLFILHTQSPKRLCLNNTAWSPYKETKRESWIKTSAFRLSVNSLSSRAAVGFFCHSERSGFNERNKLEKIKAFFSAACVSSVSWRDVSHSLRRAPASAMWHWATHRRGPLIAFRHIDGEHESAAPFCARLFDLP